MTEIAGKVVSILLMGLVLPVCVCAVSVLPVSLSEGCAACVCLCCVCSPFVTLWGHCCLCASVLCLFSLYHSEGCAACVRLCCVCSPFVTLWGLCCLCASVLCLFSLCHSLRAVLHRCVCAVSVLPLSLSKATHTCGIGRSWSFSLAHSIYGLSEAQEDVWVQLWS